MRHPTRARATAILWAAVVFPTGCGGKMLGRDTDAGANRTGSIAGSVSGAITSTGTGSGACSPSASGDIGDTSASSDASPDISASSDASPDTSASSDASPDTSASSDASPDGSADFDAAMSGSPDDATMSGCSPGQMQCSGQQPQACGSDSVWHDSGSPCSGATPSCAGGLCTKPPPSCAVGGAGLSNCGATGDSCCTSFEVTGGTYFRAFAYGDAGGPMGLGDPTTVSSFRLDKYDVTVGRFRQFVNAWDGGWRPAEGSGKHTHLNNAQGLNSSGQSSAYEPGWLASYNDNISPNLVASGFPCCTWTNAASTQENLPLNCVSWWEAYAFCIWDGGFLPSDAEWAYAAAGGSQQREYPWGSWAAGTSSQYAIYGCYYPSGSGVCGYDVSNIAPVGTAVRGAGRWGQLDLAGNLWQWILDYYTRPHLLPYPGYACTDCATNTCEVYCYSNRTVREVQGGDYADRVWTPLDPFAFENTTRLCQVGFRCARTP